MIKGRKTNRAGLLRHPKNVITAALAIVLLAIFVAADTFAQDATPAGFNAWRDKTAKQARARGVDANIVAKTVAKAQYLPRVVELDRAQPHGTLTLTQYLDRIAPRQRIERGRRLIREHEGLLNRIEHKYGVQKRFIVALWATESDFGRNMGGFNVIDALSTLAFDGRREKFFTDELFRALTILNAGHTTPEQFKGSWAGALGQTQFMPSSFLGLSVDENGDGRRDIWNTPADVFGSVANYLHKSGWNDAHNWGREVRLSRPVPDGVVKQKTQKSLAEWTDAGVTNKDGSPLPNVPGFSARLIQPSKNEGRYYLVYDNFETLMKWNRSDYFGVGVGVLADAFQ
ncbi:MAG: lytic murein transglycosylase [Rickettsiales bacterium]